MTSSPGILVFSDLDGTLLHHSTYSWRAAEPALARLRALGAGVILATSKTALEVAALRAEIGFAEWPAIVENGGGILPPGATPAPDAPVYRDLRQALRRLPDGFKGFGDMTDQELVHLTGLTVEDAARARARQFSEPGIWTGSGRDLGAFTDAAQKAGLFVQRGGRFITLSFGGTKADRMDELIDRFTPGRTIALGDAPNDIQMLERADLGVIVANSASPGVPTLPGEETGRIRRTRHEGPEGWAEAILELLDDTQTQGGQTTHG